jgi:putative endonuclease
LAETPAGSKNIHTQERIQGGEEIGKNAGGGVHRRHLILLLKLSPIIPVLFVILSVAKDFLDPESNWAKLCTPTWIAVELRNLNPKTYYVYIMSGASETLYTGMTNDLERRVFEHKNKVIKGFTSRFKLNRLLYFEEFNDALDAIAAEKKIKGWLRVKKLDLIRTINPEFKGLSEDWDM